MLASITYLIYFFVIVAEIILVIGFFLLLFGANPTAGFTQWAYRNLDRVMAPFRGIFAPIELGTTSADVDAVFDTSVLFAMIVYGILALVLSALTRWLSQRLRHLYAAEQRELQEQADEEMRASLAALATTDTTAPPQVATSQPPPASASRRHRRPAASGRSAAGTADPGAAVDATAAADGLTGWSPGPTFRRRARCPRGAGGRARPGSGPRGCGTARAPAGPTTPR